MFRYLNRRSCKQDEQQALDSLNEQKLKSDTSHSELAMENRFISTTFAFHLKARTVKHPLSLVLILEGSSSSLEYKSSESR